MKSKAFLIYIGVISIGIMFSCEEERTEYKRFLGDNGYPGFTNGYFTVHDHSIGYFNPDSGKVFPDIYAYQNGHTIGNGIHSFLPPGYGSTGLVTLEKENRVEFIDGIDFLSKGSITLDKPRNIFPQFGNLLVSYGKGETKGIALINLFEQRMELTIATSIEPGKIYMDENLYYVFSSGQESKDSVVVKLYTDNINNTSALHVIDEIPIGHRPVDFVEISLGTTNLHKGLAILCLGEGSEPASIVTFDLITQRVAGRYSFQDVSLKPINLYKTDVSYQGPVMVSNINGKIYRVDLTDRVEIQLKINKNLSEFYKLNNQYMAVSRDTFGDHSQLYTIDSETLEIIDSISIEAKAKFFTGSYH